MTSPSLLAGLDSKVEVEYSQFHVEDEGSAWLRDDSIASPEPPDEGELVRAGTDWICISSGAGDHTASARLEAWSGQPELQQGWEATADFTFAATTGRVFLNSLTMGPSSEDTLLIGRPGTYHGRVYSSGRREAREASQHGDLPEGLEHYVIQFWSA